MAHKTKRSEDTTKLFDSIKFYKIDEAIVILKKCPKVKFDQSVEFSLSLGIDIKKSEQQVRGTVSLPNGTGKKLRVVVFAKGDKAKEAEHAGADFVGSDDLVEKVKGGWVDFDAVVATPDMMREVGKLGKFLGPRGLMPTPKAGNVTSDVAKAIKEIKAGKIEFKSDKGGVVNCGIGKLSFDDNKLAENAKVLMQAIAKAKPAASKGVFLKSLVLSSTMGPGLKVDVQSLIAMV